LYLRSVRLDVDVFVYGTLTDRQRASAVVDDARFVGRAELRGLHVVDGRYPTLSPGGSAFGRILQTDDVAALDAYEGVEDGLYARISIPREDGGSVETYLGDPIELGVGDEVDWPGSGPVFDRARRYVDERDVVVRMR
jgi:gamma-glutamylcyclotransferase (GGCT)/AIG2-like uncharacterized protein YtfP